MTHTKDWTIRGDYITEVDTECIEYTICKMVTPCKKSKVLIASAPELLEACIEAQSMMKWLVDSDGDTSPDGDECVRILETLNSALYKAEGGLDAN